MSNAEHVERSVLAGPAFERSGETVVLRVDGYRYRYRIVSEDETGVDLLLVETLREAS